MRRQAKTRDVRGWGPFTGRQLTVVISALVVGALGYPFAAGAADAVFTSTRNTTPAVTAVNSASAGTGVYGAGRRFGVYSSGNLGVATGMSLVCTACVASGALRPDSVGASALAASAKTYCTGYPHEGVDWSLPGSTAGTGCDLTFANLTNAGLNQANLTNAILTRATLTNAHLFGAKLSGAGLQIANLTGADLDAAKLTGADASGANLHNALLTNANLNRAVLSNADLSGADMGGASDTGVVWSNTTCPDGTNSDNDGNTCSGHGAP